MKMHIHHNLCYVQVHPLKDMMTSFLLAGDDLVELTLTLTNLGHPQQSPPLLFVDNECAIGLATSSVRPKKSKLIDMRLDWIKERAGQNFFRLVSLLALSTLQTSLLKSCLSTVTSPPYLSFMAPGPLSSSTHTPFCRHPPTHHTPPPSKTFQPPLFSPRQELPYLSPPLSQPHLFYLSPSPPHASM
jgi:hypothetical protein